MLLEILCEKTKDDNGATTTQESKNALDLIANIDRKLLNNLHSSNHEDYLTVLDEYESNFLTRDVIVSTDKYHINSRIKNIIGIVNAECVFGAGSVPGYTDGAKFLTHTRALTEESHIKHIRKVCIANLKLEAYLQGANAIIDVSIQYTSISSGAYILIAASGTAVLSFLDNNRYPR